MATKVGHVPCFTSQEKGTSFVPVQPLNNRRGIPLGSCDISAKSQTARGPASKAKASHLVPPLNCYTQLHI